MVLNLMKLNLKKKLEFLASFLDFEIIQKMKIIEKLQ